MTTLLAPLPVQAFKDSNGNPLSGGQLYTYVAGTSTLITTYTDVTAATPNTNPIILNSRGECNLWLTSGLTYKLVLQDSYSVLIWSVDQISGGGAAAGANADITSLIGPVSAVNNVPLLHQNDIINGSFQVSQTGTNFPAPAPSTYDLDGWLNENAGPTIFTVAQVAGSTTGRLARQVTITTADISVAAGDYVQESALIEGYNIVKYVNNTFTVGFRAKVPVVGIHCVNLRNFGGDRSYVKEINFPVANVWQDCTFTVVGGLPTAGTWNYVNGIGLRVCFCRVAGSTWQTTPNAWNTGNFFATANQVNDGASVGNVWALENVTLNLGIVSAVSEISIDQETTRCQRYYEFGNFRMDSYTNATTRYGVTIGFKVTKRALPTMGSSIGFSNASTYAVDSNLDLFGFMPTAIATATGPTAFSGSWTASARL